MGKRPAAGVEKFGRRVPRVWRGKPSARAKRGRKCAEGARGTRLGLVQGESLRGHREMWGRRRGASGAEGSAKARAKRGRKCAVGARGTRLTLFQGKPLRGRLERRGR